MLGAVKEFGRASSCRQSALAGAKLQSVGEMEPCLGKGCRKGRREPELKNMRHFVGNGELPESH